MAVYTDVPEQELEDFLRSYSVGELLSYKGIAEGTENSNFLMHTSTSPFILTLYERRVETSDLPFFLGLMEHLSNRGISCPLPVKRSDGSMIGELAGRPAALITFLEGMWKRKPSADNCRQVGAALAKLHLAAADFPMSRPNGLSPAGWLEIWQRCEHMADGYMPGLEAEIDGEFTAIRAEWPETLPSGIIHADLFPDNVFFLGDELSGLIDFYFACNDFLAYDVAICLNAWCFERDSTFNLTKGAALLAGYQSVRPFEPQEVEALPVLARGAALRFLMTRLHDWLMLPDGPLIIKRDPMDYLRRLRFHRQIANASEYGLKL